MSFVIDASIALAWCFDDEASPAADAVLGRLEEEEAVVPAHWPLEVANALRTAERRGRLAASDLARLRTLLAALPVEVAPVELGTALGAVLETARSNDLTAYDAAYLDLAAVRGLALATADERLRAAAAAAGVGLVV
jgi:predicted nucleic acid-binding protein